MPCNAPPVYDPFQIKKDIHLRVDGGNVMAAQLGFVPGFQQWPGLFVVGDTRTGIYQTTPGTLSVALNGFQAVDYLPGSLRLWNGRFSATITQTNTANRTYALPDKSGTIALLDDIVGGGGGGGTRYFGETPAGTVDGVNPTFTIARTPTAGSVSVWLEALRVSPADYSVTGPIITLTGTAIPHSGEYLLVDYSVGAIGVFGETPAGTVDGVNPTFSLAYMPISGTLVLYLCGLRLSPLDYSISGLTITITSAGAIPRGSEYLLADYEK